MKLQWKFFQIIIEALITEMSQISNEFWNDVFPDGLIPELLGLVLNSWRDARATLESNSEVKITRKLLVCLRNRKNSEKNLPFSIQSEVDEIDDDAQLLGRVDLKFSRGFHEDAYFVFECKLLNNPNVGPGDNTLSNLYVREGMFRFVGNDPKYSLKGSTGGMIAYVLDGNNASAIRKAEGSIRLESANLNFPVGKQRPYLDRSSLRGFSRHRQVRETLHDLDREKPFVIHHIFLPL
jgi:hypothetical protein